MRWDCNTITVACRALKTVLHKKNLGISGNPESSVSATTNKMTIVQAG